MIMTRLIRYCTMEVPFFLRQKVERMKKMEAQITSLLRMNIPTEHSISEMKLAPSASYADTSRVGSYSLMFAALFLLINKSITIYYRKDYDGGVGWNDWI
jgi:hypothetical protein